MCQWLYPFFGLIHSKEYIASLYSEIFNLSYFSQGSISISEAYDLPIAIRKFYMKCLLDVKKKEKEEIEASDKFSIQPFKK